ALPQLRVASRGLGSRSQYGDIAEAEQPGDMGEKPLLAHVRLDEADLQVGAGDGDHHAGDTGPAADVDDRAPRLGCGRRQQVQRFLDVAGPGPARGNRGEVEAAVPDL